MELKEQVVMITGSTGGLGSAVTKRFLQQGSRVVAVYHNQKSLDDLLSQIETNKENLHPIRADVTNEDEVEKTVEQASRKHNRIDVLLNLVGGYFGGKEVGETSPEAWNKIMALNLNSAFLCSRAVLPRMQKQGFGRILSIAAHSAVDVGAGSSAYAVSKAGVITLTKAIAEENKGKGITANVVLPGIIDTPANRSSMPDSDFSKWVKPEKIAALLLFLASDQADDLTGASIPIG